MKNINIEWLELLREIMINGDRVAPRGKPTMELQQRTLKVNMRYPVITNSLRKLNYQFMAAEAFWILSGDNLVSSIAPWNKNIAQFSDDGVKFFGAYGPRIHDQLGYVVEKLQKDHHTRQAGLTIWIENPRPTKDVPCTVAIFFNIRDGRLNCNVFMRSSDAWLGIPYDVFNFSMLTHYVCGFLQRDGLKISPGTLYLTAASSHLYDDHWESAELCFAEIANNRGLLDEAIREENHNDATPDLLYQDPLELLKYLRQLRNTKPGDPLRWWE